MFVTLGVGAQPFLRECSMTWELGTLPGDQSSRTSGVNNRSQVAGTSWSPAGEVRAFFWEKGRMTALAGPGCEAGAINERGQIAGFERFGSQTHATLWDKGITIDLGVLPGRTESVAAAITNRGQVWAIPAH